MAENTPILPSTGEFDQKAIHSWFENVVDHIRTDHLMYSTGAVTTETKKFYDDVIFGGGEQLFSNLRGASSKYYISQILKDYIDELKKLETKPLKLSMALSDSKILVWAEIEDEDEKTEDALLIAEAKVNGKYYQKGFYMTSTIIEKSDKLSVPQHYQSIIA